MGNKTLENGKQYDGSSKSFHTSRYFNNACLCALGEIHMPNFVVIIFSSTGAYQYMVMIHQPEQENDTENSSLIPRCSIFLSTWEQG